MSTTAPPEPEVLASPRPTWWRRHRWILLALAVGALVRVLVMVAFRPALIFSDAHTYLAMVDLMAPFPDRVVGYGFALKLLAPLSRDVTVIAAVQHGLGLATGLLGYALLRRWSVSPGIATLAVLPVLFDSLQLLLEHAVLSDVLYDFLLLLAVAVLAWRRVPTWWVAGLAGLLLSVTVLVRIGGQPAVLSAVAFCLLAGVTWRRRVVTSVVLVVAFVVPLLGYATWYHEERGPFALTTSSGRALYMRTTTFVDCSTFDVPSYSRRLCPKEPVGQRQDPTEYGWHMPDRRAGLDVPDGMTLDGVFGEFARMAILAQPLDYLRTVGRDMLLNLYPVRVDRYDYDTAAKWWFWTYADDYRPSQNYAPLYERYGGAYRTSEPLATAFGYYGWTVYLPGPLMGALALLGVVGLLKRRPATAPATRPLLFLVLSLGVGLVVVPDITAEFVWRYMLPGVLFVPLAAALAHARLKGRGPVVTTTGEAAPAPGRRRARTGRTAG